MQISLPQYSAPPALESQSNSSPGVTTASSSIALPDDVVKGDILLGIDTLRAAGKVAGADGMDNPLPVLMSADRFEELHGKIEKVAEGERTGEMKQFMAVYSEIIKVVDQLKNKAAELKELGIDVDVMHWDPSSKSSWAALLAEIQQRLNKVTALLNQTSAEQLKREQQLNDQSKKEGLDVAGKGQVAAWVGGLVGAAVAAGGVAIAFKSAGATVQSKSPGSVPKEKPTELNTGRTPSGSRQEGEGEMGDLGQTTRTRSASTTEGETDTTGTRVQVSETDEQLAPAEAEDGLPSNPRAEGQPPLNAGPAANEASAAKWDAVSRAVPVVAHPLSEMATAEINMQKAEEQAHVQETDMAKSTAGSEAQFTGTTLANTHQSAQDAANNMNKLAQLNVDSLAAVV